MRTASPPPTMARRSAAAATARHLRRGTGKSVCPPRSSASTRSVNPGGGSFRRNAALNSLSMRFLQLAPQRLQGAVELTLDRVHAHPHDTADLQRAELFLISQRDDEALHLRQCRDEAPQRAAEERVGRAVGGGELQHVV